MDFGEIETLRLTASPRSKEILQEAQSQNAYRARSLARALEYIASNPAPLASSDLIGLASRVAETIRIGKWEGNSSPSYDESGDKALVDFRFATWEDEYVYTATFRRLDSKWHLRGVRETMQAFVIRGAVDVQKPHPPVLLPPPTLALPTLIPVPSWLIPAEPPPPPRFE